MYINKYIWLWVMAPGDQLLDPWILGPPSGCLVILRSLWAYQTAWQWHGRPKTLGSPRSALWIWHPPQAKEMPRKTTMHPVCKHVNMESENEWTWWNKASVWRSSTATSGIVRPSSLIRFFSFIPLGLSSNLCNQHLSLAGALNMNNRSSVAV